MLQNYIMVWLRLTQNKGTSKVPLGCFFLHIFQKSWGTHFLYFSDLDKIDVQLWVSG